MYVLSGINGFSCNFELCSSKADIHKIPGEPELGAASNVIVRLRRPVPQHVYHKLYFDNYFSSLHLISYLDKLGIKSVATIRSNRMKNLETMSEKEMKTNGRGSDVEKTATVNGFHVHAIQWYDNRIVSLASSYCGTDSITKVRRFFKSENCKKEIERSDIVSIDNMHMGGVDLQDSLIKIKCKKWYMRFFCHVIDIAVVNAWLLSRRIAKQLDKQEYIPLADFKTTLAMDLCWKGKTVERKTGKPSFTTPSSFPIPVIQKKMSGISPNRYDKD
nr:unnamed protein product [Callosobruchus analis]